MNVKKWFLLLMVMTVFAQDALDDFDDEQEDDEMVYDFDDVAEYEEGYQYEHGDYEVPERLSDYRTHVSDTLVSKIFVEL